MSTSRSPYNEACSVDLGAQYISVTPAYWQTHEKFYEELLDRGILSPLQSQIDGMKVYEENIRHFIVPNGISSLVKYYLQQSGAEVLYNHHVQRVHLTEGGVMVENCDGSSSACVDALILTMPVPQILQLQGDLLAMLSADQRRALEMATYSSRFALGLFYNSDVDLEFPWTAKYVSDNSVVRYIAFNKKKQSQEYGSVGPSLVVHTSVAFGLKHVDEDVNVVQPFILAELDKILPGLPQHAHGKCHKWRYSQVTRPVGGSAGYMVLSVEPLVMCTGDGFTHSNFDGCVNEQEWQPRCLAAAPPWERRVEARKASQSGMPMASTAERWHWTIITSPKGDEHWQGEQDRILLTVYHYALACAWERKMIQRHEDPQRSGEGERQLPRMEVQMSTIPKLQLSDFSIVKTLGMGTYGRVELVQLKNTVAQYFAMKIVKKQEIKKRSHEEYIQLEKEIMQHSRSNFIVKLYYTFQDMECLYLLMEAGLGGELWDILQKRGSFDEHSARFYTACVLEAVSYLHSEGIVYRDLKPENIVLDHKGYAKLIDFGFSKRLLFGDRTYTLCGTPEYMAPEVILGEGHDVSADYWSLGVLVYELLTGSPLFKSENTVQTYSLILQGISFAMLQGKVSNRAESLIRALCRVDPLQRLGSLGDGFEAVRTHRWFNRFLWEHLRNVTMEAPILPKVSYSDSQRDLKTYPEDRSTSATWYNDF